MPARRDRLAEEFVSAALELHRRRLWDDVAENALLRVLVPGEDHPLGVGLGGEGGGEPGLTVSRGADGLRRLVALQMEVPGADDAFGDAGDLLGVAFRPWGEVDDAFRRLAAAGGLRPRGGRAVPIAVAKSPEGEPRPAGRPELRLLLWVLRGLLAARDAGELRPPVTGVAREFLELEVSGEPRRPSVVARRVPLPEGWRELEPPPVATLPADLRDLPRTGGRWLVGRFRMHDPDLDGSGVPFAIVVLDERADDLLGNEIAHDDDPEPLAELLTGLFRSPELGLPRAIVFNSRRQHAAFREALASLGVETAVDERCAALEEMAGMLGQLDVESAAPPADEMPGSYVDWLAADAWVHANLREEVLEEDGSKAFARALERYFGDGETGDERLDGGTELDAFVEWRAADHRARSGARTILERSLEEEMAPGARALLEARRDARLSIFRIDACRLEAIDVEDVLTGERSTVHSAMLAGSDLEGMLLPLRLVRAGSWLLPLVAGPVLTSFEALEAMDLLERLGAELTPEGLRASAHLLGRLWIRFAAEGATEGDPIEADGEPRGRALGAADLAALEEGAVESAVREHYRRWPDEPVPFLGALTPRQACETEEGRRRVARLVRAMPAVRTPTGPIAAPRAELLRELGVE